ncbi:DUF5686 family protein [Neptunitalea lumnitzerae]|uniref:Carboxypeptidase-like regulatory domain-containing protein n=1 Tax=Neptunitalea lumnitzerae TaxID=2965509 RepID=A0ABQ5MNM8_9FLAO|nr:DUF5686 family protein [Neptunitalea sp. Y10]GLB50720.1 hypothetical protein Y10_30880 [Neptunitalea sp. Y10]
MYRLLILIIFCCTSATAQYQISGIVTDENTNTPLPFANVTTNNGTGTITNRDGEFTISENTPIKELSISYIGYQTSTIAIANQKKFYKITLKENVENLAAVTISATDSVALNIIKEAIANRKQNNPEKALNSFRFLSYSKLLVTANPDSISNTIDTVYQIKNGEKKLVYVDSTDYNLKKRLEKSHLYITEKVSEYKFNKTKGKRENILANRMAGFEEPIYQVLAIQMQSFSFYDDTYTIFGTSYTNPITHSALKEYTYKILDTVPGSRPAYLVYYKPKRTEDIAGLQGVMYIDTSSFAIQKSVAQLKGSIDVEAKQTFTYLPEQNIWFPKSKTLAIKNGETDQAVSLFGGRIKLEEDEHEFPRDSTVIRTDEKDDQAAVQMILKEQNFNIAINKPVTIKGHGLEIAFDDNAFNRDENYWNTYRIDSITPRGLETYRYIDSVGKAEDYKDKINFVLKLTNGYLPTKYIDLDLRYLLKYNAHEGFRLGMGATTNKNFSNVFKIHGYTVYGTRDKKMKFGIGSDVRLHKFTNTWLGLMYIDDLEEIGNHNFITDGRAFYVFQPRLFNIETFHRTKVTQISLSHNITSKMRLKVMLAQNQIDPTYAYTFFNDGQSFQNFTTTELTSAISWQPYSKFMLTPDGFSQIERGYPSFTLQVQQGLSDFLNGDFNYTKFNFRTHYQIQPLESGKSSITLNAGIALGDLPITEVFHVSPNSPNKASIMRRFSVAGIDNFETMYFNEFFSDRYATVMGRHDFLPFKITNKIKPQLALFSKAGWGNMSNREKHDFIEFKTLDKGYFESGLELNNILSGFGLSGAYRYGYYHLPHFDDNISFKFTYNFSLNF